MTIRTTLAVALLALASTVSAQPLTYPVDNLPTTLRITWDDPSAGGRAPQIYEVTLDSEPPIIVAAGAVPCVECRQALLTIGTPGLHTVLVRGRNSDGLSPPGTLELSVTFLITVPFAPSHVRIFGVPSGTPSPAGASVPPSLTLVASDFAVWGLSPDPLPTAGTDCPGFPAAQCRELRRNNDRVGLGYELFIAQDSAVWARGYEGLWYRWGAGAFVTPGQTARPQ